MIDCVKFCSFFHSYYGIVYGQIEYVYINEFKLKRMILNFIIIKYFEAEMTLNSEEIKF
jgi:hypothetical protein